MRFSLDSMNGTTTRVARITQSYGFFPITQGSVKQSRHLLFSIPFEDNPEGEVDSSSDRTRRAWNLVLPEALGGSLHKEETAVLEDDLGLQVLAGVFPVPELEPPSCSQAYRSNDRFGSELLLVVAVPGDPVLAVAVMVQEYGIETGSGQRLDEFPDFQ